MTRAIIVSVVLGAALAPACGGGVRLGGDGGRDGAGAADAPGEETADAAHPDETVQTDVPLEGDGGCCAPPLVLDRASGICVDPTGLHRECAGDFSSCAFGQLCVTEWGEGPIGDYCHIPCDLYADRLCPDGFTCAPVRCCDFPNVDCVPDPCPPPLVAHPWTGVCSSTQGLGMDCSTLESCNEGQDCARWMGVDGAWHSSCEIACGRDDAGHRTCPNGYACVDRDDGPENVCEPRGGLHGCSDPGALVCGFPDKFDGVARDTVCPRCYGVQLCVDEAAARTVRYLLPEGAIDCGRPGPCGAGLVTCLFPFRSGVDDCPDGRPSVFFWSVVCIAAKLEAVRSVHCYFLE